MGNFRDLVAVPSEARPGWSWWLGSWKVEAWEGGRGVLLQAKLQGNERGAWGGEAAADRQGAHHGLTTGHSTSQLGPFTDPFPLELPATCSKFWTFP